MYISWNKDRIKEQVFGFYNFLLLLSNKFISRDISNSIEDFRYTQEELEDHKYWNILNKYLYWMWFNKNKYIENIYLVTFAQSVVKYL